MYGTEHFDFMLGPVSMDFLEHMFDFFDQPFADSSAIPTYFVSKFASEKVKVVLAGDGGDELFAGYGNYKADKLYNWYSRNIPSYLRKSIIPWAVDKLPEIGKSGRFISALKRLSKMGKFPPGDAHAFWLSAFSNELKHKLYLDARFKNCLALDSINKYGRLINRYKSDDFINACTYIDMKTILPNDYLTKVDRMSMANSLEVRVPFLDHKFLEFASALSSKYKLQGFESKYILRKIMADKLPKEVVHGRKKIKHMFQKIH
ncbi:Asparagine synthase, glutamine-hydrolyzing [Candidatus Omnitrophus magneticus]|uniref:asparagine synthase (glutamine-hydrolyzing) n=1 Tax=Candidatus Omnitrophus magneticus TaxID=1609969 RepID=A0A0F0CTU2_9BACT|nr:Asparagine synthase, glutamine-hydrolyzing [Candidatus Omnitrophus magneticus]